jgi:hypothetical protein
MLPRFEQFLQRRSSSLNEETNDPRTQGGSESRNDGKQTPQERGTETTVNESAVWYDTLTPLQQ